MVGATMPDFSLLLWGWISGSQTCMVSVLVTDHSLYNSGMCNFYVTIRISQATEVSKQLCSKINPGFRLKKEKEKKEPMLVYIIFVYRIAKTIVYSSVKVIWKLHSISIQ